MNYKKAKNLSLEEFWEIPGDVRFELLNERDSRSHRFEKYVNSMIFNHLNPIEIECLKEMIHKLLYLSEIQDGSITYEEKLANVREAIQLVGEIESLLSSKFVRHFHIDFPSICAGDSRSRAPKCGYMNQFYLVRKLYEAL